MARPWAILPQSAGLSQRRDLGLAVAGLAQDLVGMLADLGRRPRHARRGEAETNRIVDRSRHLWIHRVGENTGVPGLFIVDHIAQPPDDAESDAGAGEDALPFGIGLRGKHRSELTREFDR